MNQMLLVQHHGRRNTESYRQVHTQLVRKLTGGKKFTMGSVTHQDFRYLRGVVLHEREQKINY